MKTCHIELTHGKVALVDADDYDRLVEMKWHLHPSSGGANHYARHAAWDAEAKKQRAVLMHRLITNAPKGFDVDHINHDGLDNRKENLRVCTRSENMMNRRGAAQTNSHGFIGVSRIREHWQASIQVQCKRVYVGLYPTAEEAARARDIAALEHYGEFATLNFPEVPHE